MICFLRKLNVIYAALWAMSDEYLRKTNAMLDELEKTQIRELGNILRHLEFQNQQLKKTMKCIKVEGGKQAIMGMGRRLTAVNMKHQRMIKRRHRERSCKCEDDFTELYLALYKAELKNITVAATQTMIDVLREHFEEIYDIPSSTPNNTPLTSDK